MLCSLTTKASKEVVDFLFTFLQLPLAIVVKLLTKEDAVGCLGNLYSSVLNLNHIYMQPNLSKHLLLRPTVPGPTSPPISGKAVTLYQTNAVVQLGMKEGLKILKTSMEESDMVLTRVFLD
ncbi:hypothetical protein Ahy_A09g041814 [Arachis hypogaea]|uniref:Uncharacterized protein n=1 Tax=Arachis hypogaea TaxID=3818 RepID=A0A445BDY4_ARAHY|nr:hypothetical protein Ahy_A09g041814 [Arachis hypogaea]